MKISLIQKRITLIFTIICLFAITYGIINMKRIPNSVAKVNAVPSTNKVIVLDAGHGLPDEGAVGFNSTTEEAINLQITLKIQKLLEQSGAEVVLTRSDENGIYSLDSKSIRNKKVSDIKNRVAIGNSSSADAFVSIHLNKYPPSEVYRGWQTFYQRNNDLSKNLSTCIQEALNLNIEFKNNRSPLPLSDVYIMKNVQIPTVIIECGFLSNKEECELLKTDSYQNKLAWGIFTGLQDYFETGNKGENNE